MITKFKRQNGWNWKIYIILWCKRVLKCNLGHKPDQEKKTRIWTNLRRNIETHKIIKAKILYRRRIIYIKKTKFNH